MNVLVAEMVSRALGGTWLVVAVLLFRAVFRRCPAWVLCLLWAAVAFRLVCPIPLECAWSLVPATPLLPGAQGASRLEGAWLVPVWLAGPGVMGLLALGRRVKLGRIMAEGREVEESVRVCPGLKAPVVMGPVRGVTGIPEGLTAAQREMVLMRQRASLRRGDLWWKGVGNVILALFWFHPLLWVARVCFGRDLDRSLEEQVLSSLGEEERGACLEAWAAAWGRKSRPIPSRPPWLVPLALVTALALVLCLGTDRVNASVRHPAVQELEAGARLPEGELGELISGNGAYALGRDDRGRMVFQDPHRAYVTFREQYRPLIRSLEVRYGLLPFSRLTWKSYRTLTPDSPEAALVTGFLDIYAGSF